MPEKRMRLKIPKSRFQSWHLLCCRANITAIENKRSKIKGTSTIKVSVRQGREIWRARVEVCGRVACRHFFVWWRARLGGEPLQSKSGWFQSKEE